MVKNPIKDLSLAVTKNWGNAMALEDGLVLTDNIGSAPASHSPQRVNFILMALCQRGEARYAIDTHEHQVKPGDLLFISDRHIVDNYEVSPDFDCQNIIVSTEFYHSFALNVKNVSSLLLFSMNNPVVSLTPSEIRTYNNYYNLIRQKVADTSHHYRIQLVKALLLAMFYDMSNVIWRVEQQGTKTPTRADALFAQFIRLLEDNFRVERRVNWYALQLGISAKHLSEVVKQVSKRTPNGWIDQYVTLELRVLLKNSTKSIKEIAEELHFPNQSFLGKYFKEQTGFSPSDFRKR